MLVSIVIPTKGRSIQAARNIERIFLADPLVEVEVIVIAEPEEETKRAFSNLPKYNIRIEYISCTRTEAYQVGAPLCKGKYLLSCDDDRWAHDLFLTKTLKVLDNLPNNYGYVKINGEGQDPSYWWAETGIASREFYIKEFGGVIEIPHYRTQSSDLEKSERAKAKGLFFDSESYMRHEHWFYGLSQVDETYRAGGMTHWQTDHNIYLDRKAREFPTDYLSVLLK